MSATFERRPIQILLNPFHYTAGGKALALGFGAILVAGLLGFASRTHFDGVMDTHIGAPAPLWLFLAEGFIDWLCLGLVLLGLGRLLSKTAFRTIDLLGTQALARWPTILTCVLTLPGGFQRFNTRLAEQLPQSGAQLSFASPDGVLFAIIILALVPVLCWTILLMYRSFSLCCNLKGAKAIGAFILGLIVAEILSKLALWPLVKCL